MKFLFIIVFLNFYSALDDINKGWDGTYKGREVQDGTYVVKLYATDLFGKVYKQTKQIHLIR